ncbi:hypothetical protein [Nocardia stercoris]|uniref:Uncharacterized protein n=1 Tax=Nocardia stercoris TaxID=2483361 RepID=A0A3M2LBR6_9NOCA|nr:hypothetical protein [Nocardia stercoris]RMI32128.1 hypothetical protein EBN03_14020 [Nocardia stercoris]
MSKTKAGFGITAFGAMAAAATLVAPSANAQILSISFSNPNPIVGCSYNVFANVDLVGTAFPVTFSDNGVQFAYVNPSAGFQQAFAGWAPQTAGEHVITAAASTNVVTTKITVNNPPLLQQLTGTVSSNCPPVSIPL